MRVGYIGNFEPKHSTESHVARALRENGHQVFQYQEHKPEEWDRLIGRLSGSHPGLDFVLWTRTIWNPPISYRQMKNMQAAAEAKGVPTVSYHLDRWFGLNRTNEVLGSPFFRNTLVITADGGHQDDFASEGINHIWMPPGVSRAECMRRFHEKPEFKHDVVFCGSSQSYHHEWGYRLELVGWLEKTYGDRLGLYPKDKPALRGQDLVDLYGNAKVMVGDSCLNGGITYYWSDRIPETLGRNGFLVHPNVVGLDDHFNIGEHLVTYDLGDFDGLKDTIDRYVEDDESRKQIAKAGREWVLKHHTYERRMEQVVDLVKGL